MSFHLTNLIAATGGRLLPGEPLTAHGTDPATAAIGEVVTDSRRIQSGDVFWALAGPRHDGADFIDEAFRRGAVGAVTSRGAVRAPRGKWVVEVDDSLAALWRLAGRVRCASAARVVAVTGSVGKTTTREMIDRVLQTAGRGTASPHNWNNHVGLPLSLLRLEADHRYGVFELGANHVGEIAALAGVCRPEWGVITRIGDAHLGQFGGAEQVAAAKAELLDALPSDGCAFLCGDDPWLRRMARGRNVRVVWVGRGSDCDLTADDVRSDTRGLAFRVERQTYHVNVVGRHHLTSAMLAIAVGRAFGLAHAALAESLAQYRPVRMRCEVRPIGAWTVIDDTYNASPMALHAALELLGEYETSGRRVVVAGTMHELGRDATQLHRLMGRQAVTVGGADLLVTCGPRAGDLARGALEAGMPASAVVVCPDAADAAAQLIDRLRERDVVLVKGARIERLERVVQRLAAWAECDQSDPSASSRETARRLSDVHFSNH